MKTFNRLIATLLTVLLLITSIPVACLTAFATQNASATSSNEFAGGTGTYKDPYLIATPEHLDNVRNHLSSHFRMTQDIVFSKSDFSIGGRFYNEGSFWSPIGTENNAFSGVFDGNGFEIIGLHLSNNFVEFTSSIDNVKAQGKGVGLFGCVSGTIKNLGLVDGDFNVSVAETVNYTDIRIGSIAANLITNGELDNCYNQNNINANITMSDANMVVYVGGIVARSVDSKVNSTYNAGNISVNVTGECCSFPDFDIYIGGIAGAAGSEYKEVCSSFNSGNIITKCSIIGEYPWNNLVVGGIVGSGQCISCYNNGTTIAESKIFPGPANSPGLSSLLYGYNQVAVAGIAGSGIATNCYNVGDVNSISKNIFKENFLNDTRSETTAIAGGIVGGYSSSATNCYNIGDISALADICDASEASVSSQSSDFDVYSSCGGIHGGQTLTTSNYNHCFYLRTGNESDYVPNGVKGCSSLELQRKSTYEGFDFENVWEIYEHKNYVYPTLRDVPHVADKNVLYKGEKLKFHFSQNIIEPGDIIQIGADNTKGDISGAYYPGSVEWTISNPNVIQIMQTTENITMLTIKALAVGTCELSLMLDGEVVHKESISVTLTDDTMVRDYLGYITDNATLTTLQSARNLGREIINTYSEGDRAKIAFMTCLGDDLGFSVITKEAWALLGLTTSTAEDAVDSSINDLMLEIFSLDSSVSAAVSSFKKKYKNFNTVASAIQFGQEDTVLEVLSKNTVFDAASLGKVLKIYKQYTSTSINALQMTAATTLAIQYERDVVVQLMNAAALAPGGECSDLYKGLGRLLLKIDNLENYVETNFVTQMMLDKVNSLLQEVLFEEIGASDLTFKLMSTFGSVIALKYEQDGGIFADDYIKSCVALGFSATLYNALLNSYNADALEANYKYYVASVKNMLNSAISIATNNYIRVSVLKPEAENYLNIIAQTCSYEAFLQQCRWEIQNVMDVQSQTYMKDGQIVSDVYYVLPQTAKKTRLTSDDTVTSATTMAVFEEPTQILSIPAYVDEIPVNGIADYGFSNLLDISRVIIPNSVSTIGEYAFAGCVEMRNVYSGTGLKIIKEGAFYGCASLQSIHNLNSLQFVGDYAFVGCTGLQSAIFEKNLISIGSCAFSDCTSLTSVVFKNPQTIIAKDAFSSSSKDLVIYGYAESTAQAFAKANNIQFVSLPEIVSELSIVTGASTTSYYVGDVVSTDGLSLLVTYTDNTEELLTSGWVASCDTSKEGKNTVTVYYGDRFVTYAVDVLPQDMEDIRITTPLTSLFYGESIQLDAKLIPETLNNFRLVWESSDSNVVRIDSNGYAEAISVGTAEITVSTLNGEMKDSIIVAVTNEVLVEAGKIKYISFKSPKDGYFELRSLGNTGEILGYILDESGNILNFDISKDLNVRCRFINEETYTLKIDATLETSDFYIIFKPSFKAEQIVITDGEIYSEQRDSGHQLTASFLPEDARNEKLIWSSSDANIVTVNSTGYIRLVREGTAVVKVTTSTGLSDSITVVVKEYPPITLNDKIVISVDDNSGTAIFSFEPTVTGTYVFYSYDNDLDTYGYLYDSDMNQITSNDDGGSGNNFKISYKLIAGEKYYFKSRSFSSYSTGSYSVKITILPAASSMVIGNGDTLSAYVGDNKYLWVQFSPDGCATENVTWASDDTSIVTVDQYGNLALIGVGTTTVTATSANGLTDTIVITVAERPSLTSIEIGNGDSLIGYVGIVKYLWVNFYPENSSSETVTWTSDNQTVATVNENGRVTFLAAGTVNITVTSESDLTDTCTITVKECSTLTVEQPVMVTISDNQQEYMRFIPTESGTYRFYATELSNNNSPYFNLYNESMNYLSYGYDYLDYELVAGNTYYIATNYYSYSGDGDGTYYVNAVKLVAAESVSIVPDTICGYEGYSYSLATKFSPDNSIIENISWESSDPSIVTIDNYGYMTFVSAGVATITATSENGLVTTATVTVKAADTIGLNEEKTGTVAEDVVGSVFKFTPTETGVYTVNVDGNHYTHTYIKDSDGNWINSDYAYGIELEQQMEAGKTYYICTSYWYDGDYGDYDILIKKLVPATSFEITSNDSISGYVDGSYSLSTEFYPDNAITEDVTWTSSDTAIAEVDDWGNIYFVGAGTATITATTENGLTDSVVVTVMTIPEVALDEVNTVEITEYNQSKRYKFTPSETGSYSFEIESDYTVYFELRDEYGNYITGSNNTFNYQLTAGETYYISTHYTGGYTGSYTFKISETVAISKIEITSLPNRLDYYVGFENFSYYGLKIKATFEDGSTVDWSYDSWESLAGYDVEISNDYFDSTYLETIITCGGKTVSFEFNVKENPVDHLELVSGTSRNYIENYNGYTNDEGNFIYYTNYPYDAVIKIIYTDGTSVTANVGNYVEDYYVSWNDNQYNEPWTVDSDNKSTISYLGHTVNLPITVEKNKVSSIEVVSGKVTCVEKTYGYDMGDGNYYYYYDVPSDVTVKINYADGTSKTVKANDTVDGYRFSWNDDQYETPWVLGDDNSLTLSYLGITTQLPVSVIANPVERIEINSAPTREYVYGDTEYGYLYSDGDYEFYPTDMTGLSFTVYYTDGTSKTFTYDDIDDNGNINGYGYELNYDGYNPEIGNFPVTFEYMGKSADYTVVLKESTVTSIAVTKKPTKTEYTNDYSPDFIGMELTITYTDGTTKVVALTEDNLVYEYIPWWGELCYKIEVDGHTLTIEPYYGEDMYYVAYYLGSRCEIKDITFTESKEIKSIELDNVSWNGDGMTVKVTYTDETTETLTLDIADFYDFEDSSGAGFGKTENGLLYYYIETYTGEDGNVEKYIVSILGKDITVEAETVVIGDVNADGDVNNKDVTMLRRYLIGGWNVTIDTAAADVNADGSVNNKDMTMLRRYLVGGWNVALD